MTRVVLLGRMSETFGASSSSHQIFDTASTNHNRSISDADILNGQRNIGISKRQSPNSSRSGSHDEPSTSFTTVALVDSPSQPGRAPRMRISKACTPCRKVKLKCDGGNPCGRCSSLKLPLDGCTYPPSQRGKKRRKKAEIEAERRANTTNGISPSSLMRSAAPDRHSFLDGLGSTQSQGSGRGSGIVTRWDGGRTMRNMKEDFAKWKHDEDLTVNGPRNASLWRNSDSFSRGTTGPHSPLRTSASALGHQFTTSSALGLDHDIDDNLVPDRYTTLPFPGDAHNPLGVLAEASATAGKTTSDGLPSPSPFQPTGGPGTRPESEEGDRAEQRSRGYYIPLERVLKRDAPHIMSLISISEAEQLFETYFKLLHPHLPFLDREHSTPAALAQRNNFLFNAICCVAARATNIMLWNRLKEFARFEMDRFPKDKNIDVVQGHLIYSVWNITGPMTFEQDKSWLRIGVAIRTGIDINLHRVALSKEARKGLPNWLLRMIIRTWLLTYIIDRTLSAQLGKPTTMRGEHSFQLYSELISQGEGRKTIDDAWVSSLSEWTQVLGRVHDVFGSDSSDFPTARSVSSQFPDLVHIFQKQFHQLCESSLAIARTFESVDNGRGSRFMIANVGLYNRYARLIVHSFGLQRASDSRRTDLPSAFAEYQSSAIRLIEEFESDFEGAGFARGCPDFIFTFLTFGAVSLLQGVQPQYAHLEPDRQALISLARKAAGILSRSAATPDHLPAIQHSFLTRLIDSRSKTDKQPLHPVTGTTIMDFEAFGQSVDADLSKTPWPPTGPSATTFTQPATRQVSPLRPSAGRDLTIPFNGMLSNDQGDQDINLGLSMPMPSGDLGMLESDFGWGLGMGVGLGLNEGSTGTNDGFGWLSGVGAVGGFGTDGDLGFAQDSFWRSILEGVPNGQ